MNSFDLDKILSIWKNFILLDIFKPVSLLNLILNPEIILKNFIIAMLGTSRVPSNNHLFDGGKKIRSLFLESESAVSRGTSTLLKNHYDSDRMNVEKSVGDGQMLTNQLGPRVIVVFTLDPLILIQKFRISNGGFSKLGNHCNDYCGVFDIQDRFLHVSHLSLIKRTHEKLVRRVFKLGSFQRSATLGELSKLVSATLQLPPRDLLLVWKALLFNLSYVNYIVCHLFHMYITLHYHMLHIHLTIHNIFICTTTIFIL